MDQKILKEKHILDAYEIIEERKIEDLNSYGTLLRHRKTGARIALLENDDENKVFYIGFRTPPKDSTGVAHIVEHTVLCGSDLFPLKDPFVELVKGSLNTFLNAMTYPDKTVYPVASCNDKDFQNLCHVYLDAVFHPNIYKEEKIFKQEGWHYELENPEDDITINGVVYNEMKGAFSSPDDVLAREIFNSLYPDTAYGVESGGDPDVIPELTYENYLDFHRRYYHPSNSYIYLYGDCDMAEKLAFMDENYLSHYDALAIDSFPGMQEPFDEVKDLEKEYPITEEENEMDNTYLSYNAVVGTSLDPMLSIAFQMIDYALVTEQGTPLKQALIDAGIGTDIYSCYENGIYQPYYSIVAKNANLEQKDQFIRIVEDTLRRIVKEGFDKNALLACLNSTEFYYRESDFGSTPRGLMLGLKALDSWLYDDTKTFTQIESNAIFDNLRKMISTHYFEDLVEQYLLNNTHKSIVCIAPKKGLTAEKDRQLADKMAVYKASLSQDEIAKLIRDTKELKIYQETPDSPELLKCLPRLKREDLDKKPKELINERRDIEKDGKTDIPVLFHSVFTNKIAYVRLIFRMPKLPKEYLPYLNLLKSYLGSGSTERYNYEQLGYEIYKKTGGIYVTQQNYTLRRNLDEFNCYMTVCGKAFYRNIPDIFDLSDEIINHTILNDAKRLKEFISETKSSMQARMSSSSHSVAMTRALSYCSEFAAYNDATKGIPYYRFLEEMEEHFEEKKEELYLKFEELCRLIFRKENLMVDFTGDEEGLQLVKEQATIFADKLNICEVPKHLEKDAEKIGFSRKNEAFTYSSQVQYVCAAGTFKDKGLPYTASLRVLKTILGYEYLWINVRVKGGAYGCMSNFLQTGECYFVSYRDPNLAETYEIYRQVPEFLKNFSADEEEMTKYIIGTMSEDIPLTPTLKGERSLTAYLSQITYEELQKERDQILSTTEEDIRALAAQMEAVLSDGVICTLGNDVKVKENSGLFKAVIPLFH